MLKAKKILLGICGSIAAYKTATLVRLLKKAGAEVKIVLTPSAKDFITPLTLSTLSKNPVYCDFVKNDKGEWTNHVELGLWADVFLIAPASANTIAKMAHGICDNLLLATYLSARCKVLFAPAMDLDMFMHPSTQNNIAKLKEYGNLLIEPTYGELASGQIGKGRMAEPEKLKLILANFFKKKDQLKGKRILVNAGPTYEAIDPVRFIGNHSTGKMGIALAEELAERGAVVDFVCGPIQNYPSHPNINIFNVTSAEQMLTVCLSQFKNCNAALLAAAVADYRPRITAQQKIKKKEDTLTLELVKNPDILANLGAIKKKNQILVGFALETDNEIENAKEKLKQKSLDFIVLNSLKNKGAGFRHDTNQISILDKHKKVTHFDLKPKKEVAEDIADYLVKFLNK